MDQLPKFTWTGAVSTSWTDPLNWQDSVAPGTDGLVAIVLPKGSVRKVIDIPSLPGLVIGSLEVGGGAYVLRPTEDLAVMTFQDQAAISFGSGFLFMGLQAVFLGGLTVMSGHSGLITFTGGVQAPDGESAFSLYRCNVRFFSDADLSSVVFDIGLGAGLVIGQDRSVAIGSLLGSGAVQFDGPGSRLLVNVQEGRDDYFPGSVFVGGGGEFIKEGPGRLSIPNLKAVQGRLKIFVKSGELVF